MDAINKQLYLQLTALGLNLLSLPETLTSRKKGQPDLRVDYIYRDDDAEGLTIALSYCYCMPGGELAASPILEVRVWPRLQAATAISKQEGDICLEVHDAQGRMNVRMQNQLNVDLMLWLNDCHARGHYFCMDEAGAQHG